MQSIKFLILAFVGLCVASADETYDDDENYGEGEVLPTELPPTTPDALEAIKSLKEEDMTKLASAFIAWLKLQRGNHGVAEEKLSWVDPEGKGHVQTSHTIFKRAARPIKKKPNKKKASKAKKSKGKNKKDEDDDDEGSKGKGKKGKKN